MNRRPPGPPVMTIIPTTSTSPEDAGWFDIVGDGCLVDMAPTREEAEAAMKRHEDEGRR